MSDRRGISVSAFDAQQRAFVFVVQPAASLAAAVATAATGLVAPDGHRLLLYAAAGYLLASAGLSALVAWRLSPTLAIRVALLLDVAAVAVAGSGLDAPYRVAAAEVWPIAASAVVLGGADTAVLVGLSLIATAVAAAAAGGSIEPRLLAATELGLALLGLALSAAMRPARRAQAALAERSAQDAAALAISERIRVSLALEAVLRTTVNELGRQLDAAACSLRLAALDDADGAAYEWEQPDRVGARGAAAAFALATLEQGEPVLLAGLEGRDADAQDPGQRRLAAAGLAAALGYPLRWGERTIAAVGLVSDHPRAWEREAVPLLDRLAPQLAAALAQAEAYEKQQRTIAMLEEFNEQRQQLVAAVSHELRTPVTATLGFLETLLSRRELSEQDRRRFLHEAAAGARRLARLVDDLLVLTRTERRTLPLLRERVEPQRLLEQALSGLIVPAERTVSFRSDENCAVAGDPDRLLQVLSNLLSNALVHGQGEITVSCTRDGGRVRIEVADEGPGIPSAEAEQLFVPFARFGANEGTGLGLAISRGLAEAHAGSLEYRSRGPHQHAFVLELPAADQLQRVRVTA